MSNKKAGEKKVNCKGMQEIFDEYGVKHVNFFSLDVEAYELQVLNTIDFGKMIFDVILIESDKSGKETREFMKKHPQYVLMDNIVHRSDVYVRH